MHRQQCVDMVGWWYRAGELRPLVALLGAPGSVRVTATTVLTMLLSVHMLYLPFTRTHLSPRSLRWCIGHGLGLASHFISLRVVVTSARCASNFKNEYLLTCNYEA